MGSGIILEVELPIPVKPNVDISMASALQRLIILKENSMVPHGFGIAMVISAPHLTITLGPLTVTLLITTAMGTSRTLPPIVRA
jgi:hypothetical protein